MSDVFPKWANRLPRQVAVGGMLLAATAVAGIWYYFTPKYTRMGYQPMQPVAFSHNTHADQVGLDCRYCHGGVETSWYANLPSSARCMNCHNQVLRDDPRLALVRDSALSGRPVPWVQVHKAPDFAYFNHAVHVNRGVGCAQCHGAVNTLEEVYHAQSLTMTFCLDCHRRPQAFLCPPSQVYNLNWQAESPAQQTADGQQAVRAWKVERLEQCSACHR